MDSNYIERLRYRLIISRYYWKSTVINEGIADREALRVQISALLIQDSLSVDEFIELLVE